MQDFFVKLLLVSIKLGNNLLNVSTKESNKAIRIYNELATKNIGLEERRVELKLLASSSVSVTSHFYTQI